MGAWRSNSGSKPKEAKREGSRRWNKPECVLPEAESEGQEQLPVTARSFIVFKKKEKSSNTGEIMVSLKADKIISKLKEIER